MNKTTVTPELILKHALTLAQQRSWQGFSLIELADQLDYPLTEINHFFRSKDDLAEALFDGADEAVLALASDKPFRQRASEDKLVEIMMTWFSILSPYKAIVREILAYKLEPGHFHLQAHGVTRVSRTVQWFLEVAERRHVGLKRIADEVAVTSVYLASFRFFLFDESEHHQATRHFLQSKIQKIEHCQQWFSC